MAILVFGKTGQVARELIRARSVTALGRDGADLADPAACGALVRSLAPDAVINAAAFTDVDEAEAQETLATVINGEAPGAMARAAAQLGIPFVHISTDYVFDGAGDAPWQPADQTGPIGAYGRSKLAGEQAVAAAGGAFAILRTSWVFSAHGTNFVKTMLRLGRERVQLRVVADQIGGPTPAAAIASAVLRMVDGLSDGGAGGLYHFAGTPNISWAGFAREIFAQAGLRVDVQDIAVTEFPTPARRPANSRLECGDITREFRIKPPDWRDGLTAVLAQIGRAPH
ncbi:MAG: dTDP-4-dehydrorhamnose reductase [Paracoccaceae bacterium]